MQPIEARRSQAGTLMRCPWCHTPIRVPQESREDRKFDQYDLSADGQAAAGGPEAAPASYIPVVCGLCRTRMYAAPEQVGEKLICPDCGTPTIVVRPAPKTPGAGGHNPTEEGAREVDSAGPDIYNVFEGTDQPSLTDKAVYGRYVPVICGVCHTRMLATEDQVGQEVICPDCGQTTRVPPSPGPRPPLPGSDVTQAGEYGLGGVNQPAPGSAALREQFTYRCPVCSTRLLAMPEEAGCQTQCPDCLTTFAIPEPPAKIRASGPEEGVDPYRTVGKVVVAPPVQISGFAPVVGGDEPLRRLTQEELELRGERFVPEREAAPLPSWPFVRGVFTFPFYRDSWPRWVMFTLGATVWAAVGGFAATLIDQGSLITVVGGIIAAMAAAIAILWFLRIASTCLTIVVDTAGGFDRIEDWHTGEWVERFTEFLYVVSSYAWGGAIGLAVDAAVVAGGGPRGAGIAVSLFLFPPIALLSMLEMGGWASPVSLPLWGSLFWGWWGWTRFYLMAALLDAAVVLVSIALGYALDVYALFLSPALFVTWCMIYFRLLGRLGLYCADRVAQQRREAR